MEGTETVQPTTKNTESSDPIKDLLADRESQALDLMEKFEKKFGKSCKKFNRITERIDEATAFLVIKQPVVEDDGLPEGNINKAEVSKHLLLTAAGFRVLEFRDYLRHSMSSWEQSEAGFQTGTLEGKSRSSVISYYDIKDGRESLFIPYGSGSLHKIELDAEGKEDSAFVKLRRPEEGEAQKLIDIAKERIGIKEVSIDETQINRDIHDLSSVKF